MTVSRFLTALLVSTLAICSVQAEEAAQGNSVIDKTGRAIGKGAKATADGAEYVAEKVVHGVKRGANAAARGVERGAHATGNALETAAEKVGIKGNGGNSKDSAASTGSKADGSASGN